MRTPETHELSRILVAVGIMLMIFGSITYFYLTAWLNSILDNMSKTESNILGNLTDHRRVANQTRDLTIHVINQTVGLVEQIKEGTNIQISQHTIHTDRELGDLNGNLTKLLKQIINQTGDK